MPSGIYTTVIGNLVADPELRFTSNGMPVANLTIANTPRFLKDGEWMDGETTFVRCNVWGSYAENVAASLNKGEHVVAYGRIAQRTWEDREGEKRYSWEMTVEEMGGTLRFGETRFRKNVGNAAPVPEEKNVAVKRSKAAPKSRSTKRTQPAKAAPVDDDDPWAMQEPPLTGDEDE